MMSTIKALFISFLIVFGLQITINKPELPEIHAEIKTTKETPRKTQKKKTVKHTTKKKKAARVAPVQPQRIIAPAPVSANEAKAFIYSHESGNRTDAINPSSGACGLGQALPCSKMPCTLQDYTCQDQFFTSYMISRYGTWENARNFWQSNGWW